MAAVARRTHHSDMSYVHHVLFEAIMNRKLIRQISACLL